MKNFRFLLCIVLALVLSVATFALVACDTETGDSDTNTDGNADTDNDTDTDTDSDADTSHGDFTLSDSTVTLSLLGATHTLVGYCGDHTTSSIEWTIDDRTIATIEDGVVTAVSNGTANVTATHDDVEVMCEIVVDSSLAVVLGYDSNLADIAKGETLELNPTIQFEKVGDSDSSFTAESSDARVVTVDADGKLTATGNGVAVVTVTSTLTSSTYTWGDDGVGYYDIPATANVVVIVGNEFDATTHADLVGTYRASIEWTGVASSGSTDTGLIVAELVLSLYEDGTFYHNIANGKRAGYNAESSTSMHPFNAQLQESSVLGDAYLDIAQSSMTHISQKGYFAVIDGDLVLILVSSAGTTSVQNYGAVADSAWAEDFTAISDMVAIHDDMSADLAKDATFADVAGTYSYTGTNGSVTQAVLNADGTFTFSYNGTLVTSGNYYIVGNTVYLPYSNDADGEGEMYLLWSESGTLYGKVVIGYGMGFTWTLTNDHAQYAGEWTYTYSDNLSYRFTLNADGTFTYEMISAMMGTSVVAEGNFTVEGTTLTFPCDADDLTVMTLTFDGNGAISGTVVTGGMGTRDYTFTLAGYEADTDTDVDTDVNADPDNDRVLSADELALVGSYTSVESYSSGTSFYTLTLLDNGTFTYVRSSDNSYMTGTWSYADGSITLTVTDTVKADGTSSALESLVDYVFVLEVGAEDNGAVTFGVTTGYEGYGLPAIFSMGMSASEGFYPIYNFTAQVADADVA